MTCTPQQRIWRVSWVQRLRLHMSVSYATQFHLYGPLLAVATPF